MKVEVCEQQPECGALDEFECEFGFHGWFVATKRRNTEQAVSGDRQAANTTLFMVEQAVEAIANGQVDHADFEPRLYYLKNFAFRQ